MWTQEGAVRALLTMVQKQQAAAVEKYFEKWCGQLLEMKFEVRFHYSAPLVSATLLTMVQDPLIRKRVLQLLVTFSTRALDSNPAIMLRVLEHILMTWPALQPEHRLFNDAIRDLQTESMVELQRLASKMPDPLLVSCIPIWLKLSTLTSPHRTSTTSWKPRFRR